MRIFDILKMEKLVVFGDNISDNDVVLMSNPIALFQDLTNFTIAIALSLVTS